MTFHNHRICLGIGGIALGLLASACSDSPPGRPTASVPQYLTVKAECLAESDGDSGSAWRCGQERVVECEEHSAPGSVETLSVDVPDCPVDGLAVNPGPYALGSHEIDVFARNEASTGEAGSPDGSADAGGPICSARLTIVDTTPPQVQAHDETLWPPNHRMHEVLASDCVTATDACDDAVDVRFLWATSDEAPDALGSGHREPDVEFGDCRTVRVRAERMGGGDGRVYELGFRATDHSGNSTEGTCRVMIPHDQGGHSPTTGVAAYRVDAPADCGG